MAVFQCLIYSWQSFTFYNSLKGLSEKESILKTPRLEALTWDGNQELRETPAVTTRVPALLRQCPNSVCKRIRSQDMRLAMERLL